MKTFVKIVRKRFGGSGFLANVAMLTGGTIAARAILFLATPFITRIYSPADFEMLAVYMSVLALITVVAAARFDIAIPLPKDDQDAANVLTLALVSLVIVTLVLTLWTLVCPDSFAGLLGQPEFTQYLWLIPIGVFAGGTYQVLQLWQSRKNRYSIVSRTRIIRAIGGAGTQIGLGLAGIFPLGLLFGHMVYSGMGSLGLGRDMLKRDMRLFHSISFSNLQKNLKTYHRFPLFSVPEALMNSAGTQLPILIIAANTENSEAGFLMLAMLVMSTPLALIGRSVGQVYLAEAAARHRAGTLGSFTRKAAWSLFAYSVIPIALLGFAAPFLFRLGFGYEWVRAGVIVQWMAPWVILQFVASPLTAILHATGRLPAAMVLQIIGFALRVGSVLLAVQYENTQITEIYALSGAVFYGINILVVLRAAK